MCSALRVFISGHGATPEAKQRFHAVYAGAWLWASDPVLSALNEFIELQVLHAANPGAVEQQRLKSAYTNVVVAMRKDAGFPATVVEAPDYHFVQFT